MPAPEMPGHHSGQVARARQPAARGALAFFARRHLVIGIDATSFPTVLWIVVGMGLGPAGVGLISASALQHLDVVVTVSLALLGILVGLGLPRTLERGWRRSVLGAGIEATIAIGIVVTALWFLLRRWGVPLPMSVGMFCLLIGICACASAAVTHAGASDALRRAARIADVDDVPLVVLGTVAVAMLGPDSVATRLLLTIGGALSVGIAGCLLFERAGNIERPVFIGGAVLLLGGIGRYLGTSGLLSGCVAALLWVHVPGLTDRIASDDLRRFQHPLIVLLLIISGALVEWSVSLLWLSATLLLLRLTAKLLAGAAIARLARVPATLLASVLLPPGVLGIALALNAHQLLGANGTLLVGVVTLTVASSELVAVFLAREHEEWA